ncbi:hypothetical protein ACLB1E_13220 [Escherichia coli]
MQYAKDTQRTTLPHIRSITMEREQDSIIIYAATRRNLEITQNLAGGAENTLASAPDCTVTPMGSRMLKRWLHMPVRDTRRVVLTPANYWRIAGFHRRATAGTASGRRPGTYSGNWLYELPATPSGPYAPRFPATAGAACAVKLSIVHWYRRYVRRWASLPSCAICWSEQSSTHRRCWYETVVLSHRAITKSWMSGARWLTARPIIWSVWKSRA